MKRQPVGPNPCLACGAPVKRSTPTHALCRDCCSASYVRFTRENRHLDPSEWGRRLNAFHSDIQMRAQMARAELGLTLAVAVA